MAAAAKRERMEASQGMAAAVNARLEADAEAAGFATVGQYLDHLEGQAAIAAERLRKARGAAGLAEPRAGDEGARRVAEAALGAGYRDVAEYIATLEAPAARTVEGAHILTARAQAFVDAMALDGLAVDWELAPPAEALAHGELVVAQTAFDPEERGRRAPGRTVRNLRASGVVKLAHTYPEEVSIGMVKAGHRYGELKDAFAGAQGRAATMRYDDAPRGGSDEQDRAARAERSHQLYLQARAVLRPEQVQVIELIECAHPPVSLSRAGQIVYRRLSSKPEKTFGMAKEAAVDALWRLSVLFGYTDAVFAGRSTAWGFVFHGRTL